jgi:H+-transporting ATPase
VAFAVIGTALTGRGAAERPPVAAGQHADRRPPCCRVGRQAADCSDAFCRKGSRSGGPMAHGGSAPWCDGRGSDRLLGGARVTGRVRRASTVALVALVGSQLGQTLLDSPSIRLSLCAVRV